MMKNKMIKSKGSIFHEPEHEYSDSQDNFKKPKAKAVKVTKVKEYKAPKPTKPKPVKIAKKHGEGKNKVERVLHEFKENSLHSGSKKGPKVKSHSQAVAIALSEARKSGASIPKKKK